MKLSALLAGIVLSTIAAPAAAAEPLPLASLAPADGATVAPATDVLFEATLGPLAPPRSTLVVDVAKSPALDPDGTLADANLIDSLVLDQAAPGSATFGDISPAYVPWHAGDGTYYWQLRAERRRGDALVGPVRVIQVRSPFTAAPQTPQPGQPVPDKPAPSHTPANQRDQLRPKLDVFDVGDRIGKRGVAIWLWCDGCRVEIRPRLLIDGREHRLPAKAIETGGELKTRLRLRARDRRLAARALALHRRVALRLSLVGRNTFSDQRDSERVTRRIYRATT